MKPEGVFSISKKRAISEAIERYPIFRSYGVKSIEY